MDTSPKKYLHPFDLGEVMTHTVINTGDIMLGTVDGTWVDIEEVHTLSSDGNFWKAGSDNEVPFKAVQYMTYAEHAELVAKAKAIVGEQEDPCNGCTGCDFPDMQDDPAVAEPHSVEPAIANPYPGETAVDNRAHNSHYTKIDGYPQPIETIRDSLTPEEFAGYLKGNALKYMLRAGEKVGEPVEKDLDKGRVYSRWFAEWNTKRHITLL